MSCGLGSDGHLTAARSAGVRYCSFHFGKMSDLPFSSLPLFLSFSLVLAAALNRNNGLMLFWTSASSFVFFLFRIFTLGKGSYMSF